MNQQSIFIEEFLLIALMPNFNNYIIYCMLFKIFYITLITYKLINNALNNNANISVQFTNILCR